MPDDQLGSVFETQALGSAPPSASHPPMSGSSPKQDQNVVDARITWPVPHIMIHYGDIKFACGRQAIMGLGKAGFLEWMYQKFMWKPLRKYDIYKAFHFESSKYSKEAVILGTFYDVHGANDTGPVLLGELGWAEMMENVVKLDVVYDEDLGSEEHGLSLKQG